jgi:hypothetical protein
MVQRRLSYLAWLSSSYGVFIDLEGNSWIGYCAGGLYDVELASWITGGWFLSVGMLPWSICIPEGPWLAFLFLHDLHTKNRPTARAITPTPTPTPIPAAAPVLKPEFDWSV